MIAKIKQFINDNTTAQAKNKVILAFSDLKLIINDTQFISQLEISNRLSQFFINDQTKILFLNQMLQLVGHHLQQQENFWVKLKMLVLIHIIISSQIARSDFSRMIIDTKLNINIKAIDETDKMLGQLCQSYYCYIYKQASQTILINEDFCKPQDDLMIYFTLSNQCYIGMNMQRQIETIINQQVPNDIIAHLVKLMYFDIQDIYIFILKDVKYLIEKNPNIINNKFQLLELYKECQSLQARMLIFYKFNRIFPHFKQIMPPHSISIKNSVLNSVMEEKKMQSIPRSNPHEIREPLSVKNSETKFHDYSRSFSPKEKY